MERRTHRNEQRGIDGELSMAFDIVSGRIDLTGTGFWSRRQVEAHFADLATVIARIRAGGSIVRVLVDLTQGVIQSPEVAELIATTTARIYGEDDAIAMLVSASLTKMQMRRVLDGRPHAFFLSRTAAESWLEARQRAATTPAAA